LITWQWRPASDAPEVLDLVARAAAADQEMGFSTIASGAGSPDGQSFDLLARTTRTTRPRVSGGGGGTGAGAGEPALAGCLRLHVTGEGAGEACLLTDPGYRSLGIATAVLEGLRRPSAPGSGWPSPGLRRVAFWAAGSHPAAERLARRFGLPVTAELVRLRRRLTDADFAAGSADSYPLVDLDDLGANQARLASSELAAAEISGWRLATAGRRAAAESDQICTRVALSSHGQPCGLVRVRTARPAAAAAATETVAGETVAGETAAGETLAKDRTGLITAIRAGLDADRPAVLRALITDAVLTLAAMGQDSVEVALTAEHAELAALLRSMRFRHDQTDVCYELS
jgi:mycothiol synthase